MKNPACQKNSTVKMYQSGISQGDRDLICVFQTVHSTSAGSWMKLFQHLHNHLLTDKIQQSRGILADQMSAQKCRHLH